MSTIEKTTKLAILLALTVGLATPEALAWGPRAKRTISGMAMQVIKDEFPSVFRPGGMTGPNYEEDVLRGTDAGYAILGKEVPLGNDAETIQAVSNQIQLLRDVRQYGPSSYFAYRMGVLSALVGDIMMPYGFVWNAEDERIQQRMNSDIEANIDGFGFNPRQMQRYYLRDPREYFEKARSFYAEDKRIIHEDYLNGAGFNGFLAKSGPAYFERSVEAVTDAWYTVLRPEGDASQPSASRRALAWYFVDEMNYLLTVKQNLNQADKVYNNFVEVNPGLPNAFDKVGDMYYAFGTPDTAIRGVREWKTAFDMPASDRAAIASKLTAHFMKEGKAFLESAAKPGSKDTDLPNALNNFEQAMEFERTNKELALMIEKTHKAIAERKERYETMVRIIAAAEKTQAEAEKARLAGDRGGAISTYRQAIALFSGVSNEFKDLENTSKESTRKLNKSINDTINEILDEASDVIDKGEKAKDNHEYEQAIAEYSKVPTIVGVIPDDVNPQLTQDKQQVIELATRKIEEAKVAKLRYDEIKKEAEEAAKRGKKGGAAAGGGTAAQPAAGGAKPKK
ncbi:MAG TPA: hypothetical protein PLI09_22485 [Candidatus Hydrogenedentes bacterium]|nr:hypothetical protein [Candidatus Hydrogenedentota bacterium]